jgi:hypothetical protein
MILLVMVCLVVPFSPGVPQALAAAPGPWWADYFANADLAGSPVLTRQDAAIHFNWGNGSPDGAVPSDNFSVRWTRSEWFVGGTYRFMAGTDDGFRIFVDGMLILEDWRERWAEWVSVDYYLPQGDHTVVVEYFERGGEAIAQVTWEKVIGGEAWHAVYYDNQTLSGAPLLIRNEEAIDHDWGSGSPDPAVPADDFSVRWTRTLGFTAGNYRFLASCDDGVRILVDGQLVVDHWENQSLPNTSTGELALAAGQHTVMVEYYEDGDQASAHVWWELRDPVTGWRGSYYDNPDLVGGPALVRDDAEISFDWGVGPAADWMPDDHFSVRWVRTVSFEPGYYIFYHQSDDGIRFWLDEALLVNEWHPMEGVQSYLDGVYLEGRHELKVEYYEHTGHARVSFWWGRSTPWGIRSGEGVGSSTGDAVDVSVPPFDDPWEVEFYANPDLEGAPVLTRIDTSLDNYWGLGAPAPGVPADGFSVRWTQPLPFETGTYRFTTTTDDGVRLWVDGRLLIDAWSPMRGSRSATVWLNEGMHDVRMEYFERSGAATARLTWQRVVSSYSQSTVPSNEQFEALAIDLFGSMLGLPDLLLQQGQ